MRGFQAFFSIVFGLAGAWQAQQVGDRLTSPLWLEWTRDLESLGLGAVALHDSNAREAIRTMCSLKYNGSENFIDLCTSNNFRSFKNQRGRNNGIYQSFSRTSACSKAVFGIESGNFTISLDHLDSATDLASQIVDHFKISPSLMDSVKNHISDIMKAIPENVKSVVCPAAKARRNWHERNRDLQISYSVSGDVGPSAVQCTYPFRAGEWRMPEMAALIPMGTCMFRNLYIHNNEWYYVSDTQTAADIPPFRVNTREIEFRPVTYQFKPRVVTVVEMKSMIREATQRTRVVRLVKVTVTQIAAIISWLF
jgi:hypothetical protein